MADWESFWLAASYIVLCGLLQHSHTVINLYDSFPVKVTSPVNWMMCNVYTLYNADRNQRRVFHLNTKHKLTRQQYFRVIHHYRKLISRIMRLCLQMLCVHCIKHRYSYLIRQLQWQVWATTPYAGHGSIGTCLADVEELGLVTVSYAWFGFISISCLFRLSRDIRSE